jgi:hypothetical protein
LNKYPSLCDRYLEILLAVSDEIRNTVLDINPIPGTEEGYITQNSFKYTSIVIHNIVDIN